LTKQSCVKRSYPFPMKDIYEIRRENLAQALQRPRVSRLSREQDKALLLGISASMFSQAKHPEYKMGDELARKVEAALGLETGWMDNNHSRSAASQPAGLDAGILAQAIEFLEREYQNHGHSFVAKDESEYIALAYDYLAESLDNVVHVGGFIKGLMRGRDRGNETGVAIEKASGTLGRRTSSQA